jgi:hypothetical protein
MIVAPAATARFFRGIEVVPDAAQSGTLDPAAADGAQARGTGARPELVR